MKAMKKAISVLLLVCMVSALCSAGAYAVETETQPSLSVKTDCQTINLDLYNNKEVSLKGNITVQKPSWYQSGETGYTESWSWTPANNTIATADSNGTITAKSVGTTTVTGSVTYTYTDSANEENSKTATANATAITVNVTNSTPTANSNSNNGADSVTITKVEITGSGVGPYSATATFSDNGSYEVTWNWSVSNNGVSFDTTSNKLVNNTFENKTVTLTAKATATINGQSVENSAITENITVPAKAVEFDEINIAKNDNGSYTATAKFNDGKTYPITSWVWSGIPSGIGYNASGDTITLSNSTASDVTMSLTATANATVNSTSISKAGSTSVTVPAQTKVVDKIEIKITSSLVNNTITARGSTIVLYAKVYKDNALITDSKVSWSITQSTSSNGLTKLTDNGCIDNAWTASVTGNFNGDYIMRAACVIGDITYSQDVSVKVAYAPSIVAGNYSVWGGRDALSFLVNDHINNWNQEIWIDGTKVSSAYYTCIGSSDGEIWLTLSPYLLNMINQYSKNSTHTLVVGDTRAAAATGYFRTWGTASSFNGVKTGDDAAPALWAALLAVSAVGAGAAVVIYKRRKTGNG